MIKLIRSLLVAVLLMVPLGAMGSTFAPAAPLSIGLGYQWHTFYGLAASLGEFRGIAVDAAANVYLAGYTNKSWGSPLHAYSGDFDLVVMKLNSRGQYQWHTYYGANHTSAEDGDDEGAGIAADANGNLFVTGYSDRTWQGPGNIAPLHAHGGDGEYTFVLRLNSSGAYQWHTFYQPGRIHAIALDGGNNIYLTGYSSAQWGSPKHASIGNLVVLKLNSSGAYQWHTYYGAGAGAADEAGYSIAAAPDGAAVYLTGTAPGPWLGDGNKAPLHAFSGGAGYSTDLFVLKLSSLGGYQWHTFYGASENDDYGFGIAVDATGSPCVTGYSYASWGTPRHAHRSQNDIAVLRLTAGGAYQWHTFYGSDGADTGASIAVAPNGLTYLTGWSAASWQGDANSSPMHAHSGGGTADITVLVLDSSGAYQRHTFYGAAGKSELSLGIAIGGQQEVFTTGLSKTTWLGDGGAGPLHPHSGAIEGDGFVLKLSDRVARIYLPLIVK